MLICPERHLVACTDAHMGYTTTDIRSVENQELLSVKVLTDNRGAVENDDQAVYHVDDAEVDQETYQEEMDDFNAINWQAAGTQYTYDDLYQLG